MRKCLGTKYLLLGLGLALVSWLQPAVADVEKHVLVCADIAEDSKRLACYDAVALKLGLGQSLTGAATSGGWHVQTKTSPIDDSTNVYASLDADSEITGWPRKRVKPTLILRCKENRTEAYVITGMSPRNERGHYDSATVTLRFNQDRAYRVRMDESTDGDALFFREPIHMIKKMLRHGKLLFQFTPFNSSPTMTTFQFRGLQDALLPLRKACHW